MPHSLQRRSYQWALVVAIVALQFGASPTLGETSDIDLPVIPPWDARGTPLTEYVGPDSLSSQTTSITENPPYCELQLSFEGTQEGFAQYFDSLSGVTKIFMGDYHNDRIVAYDIDVALEATEVSLPIPYGLVWLATDLDLDGNIELVVQRGDFGVGGNGYLDILSAPFWTLRKRFVMPGMKVYMYPHAVNLDDDPELEIYLTPHSIGGSARAQIIDYNSETNTFETTSDIPAPTGTSGTPAVGDFDDDGRIEFISGNWYGYGLFEYDGSALSYIGMVVADGLSGNNYSAASARPKPDGVLYALVGHSSGTNGNRYQLLKAVGDNDFVVTDVFQEFGGGIGVHPCQAADVDSDSLDELAMGLHPFLKIWEWNGELGEFSLVCSWDEDVYGTFLRIQPTDLDQDGVAEWATVNHNELFQAFADTRCVTCVSPPQGLAAWWPLDEANLGTAQDVWGHANGQLMGDFAAFAGKVAGGLGFGGTEDYVQASGGTTPGLDAGDFSLATWYRSGTAASVNPIISKQDTVQSRGWALWVGDGNHIGLELADGAAGEYTSPSAGTITDATWHHVAVTIDRDNPSGITFFLDGAIIGVADPTTHTGSLSNGADLNLGSASILPNETSYLFGVLDEVQVFDRALDPYEIQDMFEADSLGECKPHRSCDCSRQGDIANEDGALDMPDVIGFVNYLFAGAATPVRDLSCPSIDRGDLNCDNFDNALDLCALIDVIFAGKTFPCEPCGATGL